MFSCLQILEAFLWFVLITLLNVTLRSEERFSRNAETDLVCRLLLEKKKKIHKSIPLSESRPKTAGHPMHALPRGAYSNVICLNCVAIILKLVLWLFVL